MNFQFITTTTLLFFVVVVIISVSYDNGELAKVIAEIWEQKKKSHGERHVTRQTLSQTLRRVVNNAFTTDGNDGQNSKLNLGLIFNLPPATLSWSSKTTNL